MKSNHLRRFTALFSSITVYILFSFFGFHVHGSDSTSPAPEKKTYQWKIDDIITAPSVDSLRVSPDGKWVVWAVTRWNLEKHLSYQEIYLTSLDKKGNDIQLTRDNSEYSLLQWVPGEHKISFITNREFEDTKGNNIWLMPLTGGEPYPVTNFKKGVESYAWIDANRILILAEETESLLETEIEKQKDTSEVVEDEDHPGSSRLFIYDISTEKTTRLTGNTKPISVMFLSEDKKQVIYGVEMSLRFEQNQEIRPKYFLMNIETKESKEILADLKCLPDGAFYWEKDSKGFYFTADYNKDLRFFQAGISKLFHFDITTNKYTEVNLQWDRYLAKYGESIFITPNGFIAKLIDGARFIYARFTRKGNEWKRSLFEGPDYAHISSIELSQDGSTAIYQYSTASIPPRFYLAKLKNNILEKNREVMDIDSPLFKKPLAKSEVITWKGFNNETIEGILYYPLHYEAGKKYPLVLMIHGGPFYADMDSFNDDFIYPTHLYCERDVFVLKPNYHGSSNYGLDFAESIVKHYYDIDVQDIEAGVDYLIEQGKVDKDKLGIIGHSNGAILGTGLIVHSHRYKAAALNAGDVNWTSDFGTCSFGVSFDTYYLGGTLFEKRDEYIRMSPLFQMEKVTTPTLIFHGEKDRQVPYTQGWEFYRALQVIGKAPVRFISFPEERHVLKKLSHQRRKMSEEIAWFEKYLFNNYKAKNESFKKGSPLDILEKTKAFSKHKEHYGVFLNGILVPETVEFQKKQIGRFEVTRAQWKSFEKEYTYEPGTGNFPVTGITYSRAKEYVEWLSKQTGKTYRLPTEEESTLFYKKPSGNTFDYWAGYEVNPDDYKGLLEELKKYGEAPALLKQVGSFAADPETDDRIYDLNGNAAELITTKDGKGKTAGGSAIVPADERSDYTPLFQYTGFRVVSL